MARTRDIKYYMKKHEHDGEVVITNYNILMRNLLIELTFYEDEFKDSEPIRDTQYFLNSSKKRPLREIKKDITEELIEEGYILENLTNIPEFIKDYINHKYEQYYNNKEYRPIHEQVLLEEVGETVDAGLHKLLKVFNSEDSKYYAPTAYSCEGEVFGEVLGNSGYIMFTDMLDPEHPIMQAVINSGREFQVTFDERNEDGTHNKEEIIFESDFYEDPENDEYSTYRIDPEGFIIEHSVGHITYDDITVIRWGLRIPISELEEIFEA